MSVMSEPDEEAEMPDSTVTLGDVTFDPVATQDFRLSVEGTSGMGKSNTLAVILEDLADVSIPTLIIERLGALSPVRLEDEDIGDCYDRAKTRIRRSNLSSLTYHHQLLYSHIYRLGDRSSRLIHEWYDDHADALYQDVPSTPVGKRQRRNILSKLVAYDLIERTGPQQQYSYHLVDADVKPVVELSAPIE